MNEDITKEIYHLLKEAGFNKKQKQIDCRSCVDCKYSYTDDLYNELCCSNENHGRLTENDPISPETFKPCCKYYSD